MNLFSRLFGKRPGATQPSPKAANQTSTWPFDQSPDAAAITTVHVLEGREVRAVVHYSDDHSWAFLCGTTDDKEDGRVITMQDAIERDETLRTIADLPPGWKAWRERRGAPWEKADNSERG